MIIKKKRIRNLMLNLPGIPRGKTLVFALPNLPDLAGAVAGAGFPTPCESGSSVLPSIRGPVSRFNAEGKFIVHRDQPKETVYRQREWHWVEWHGQDKVERSDIKDIPYQRYPRTFIPPPSVELGVATKTDGQSIIVADPITFSEQNDASCLHVINLYLELFGECHVLDQDLDAIIRVEVRRLNWHVLPPGVRPWGELAARLRDVIKRFDSDGNIAFRNNLDYINSFGPSFAAVGRAGFSGYVIFGFPQLNLYVCESVYKHNATYVFENDWQTLSQMTKAAILDHNLQKDRIIHMPGWHARVRALLDRQSEAA
ncbi:hypothetical protein [Tautonia sociabilis]|uniref:Uncharacterized protein n=1 Tax=Tautonia sociabilis TaxID=2080755 RepID=A0A432MEN3_9BACT|nr:hypothetical protein [Tautonia sociabilis]RUL84025.1 hypothetical protein TsocGM_21120 [Tautonia sociabilis]